MNARRLVPPNVRTREMCQKSFQSANRYAEAESVTLVPASAVGLLLDLFPTTKAALEACERMPRSGPWPRAHHYLTELVDAEVADTERPQAAGGQ